MQDTYPQIHTLGPRLQPFGALADASSRDRCRSESQPASPVATMHLEPAHLLALNLVFPAIALRLFSPLAADHARLHLLREPKNLLLKIGSPVSLPRRHWSIAPVLRMLYCDFTCALANQVQSHTRKNNRANCVYIQITTPRSHSACRLAVRSTKCLVQPCSYHLIFSSITSAR